MAYLCRVREGAETSGSYGIFLHIRGRARGNVVEIVFNDVSAAPEGLRADIHGAYADVYLTCT